MKKHKEVIWYLRGIVAALVFIGVAILASSCGGLPKGDTGVAGVQGADGEAGPTGAPGQKGDTGDVGPTGPQGPQGDAGAPGTVVTQVQFCPGYVTTYPSTFPEFGLCISSHLYAVYWDKHNAWLAEVMPGYYASTSTNAPCNFHVAASCQVSL